MAERRRLQQEIEKTLKRVDEGVEAFTCIHLKLQQLQQQQQQQQPAAAQREKLENEFKKEIKKLQRVRENIKGWQQHPDIKDKHPLDEARRKIERGMELFKVCERESKIKAFSKEGLASSKKVPPNDQVKQRHRTWVVDAIQQLEQQIDLLEADEELMISGGSRGRRGAPSRSGGASTQLSSSGNSSGGGAAPNKQLHHHLRWHRWHLQQLEQLLRLIDNNGVDFSALDDVCDCVADYLHNHQEPEFVFDDQMYAVLNLEGAEDKPVGISAGATVPGASAGSAASAAGDSPEERRSGAAGSSSAALSSATRAGAASSSVANAPGSSPSQVGAAGMEGGGSGGGRRANADSASQGRGAGGNSRAGAANNLGNTNSGASPPPPAAGTIAADSRASAVSASGSSSSASVWREDDAASSANSPPSAAASTALTTTNNNPTGGSAPLPSTPPSNNGPAAAPQPQAQPAPTCWSALVQQSAAAAAAASEGASSPPGVFRRREGAAPTPASASLGQGAAGAWTQGSRAAASVEKAQSAGGGGVGGVSVWKERLALGTPEASSRGGAASAKGGDGAGPAVVGEAVGGSAAQQRSATVPAQRGGGGTNGSALGAGSATKNAPSANARDEAQLQRDALDGESAAAAAKHKQQALHQHHPLQPQYRSSSLSGVPVPRADLETVAALVESSQRNAPTRLDADKFVGSSPSSPFYSPPWAPRGDRHGPYIHLRAPWSCAPPSFPTASPPIFESKQFFSNKNMDTDTLFFIFYYQQGTRQQLYASQNLKRMSWRFHKKFSTWLQRHHEPRVADRYEQGTYVYFDYENGWCSRFKPSFTFEYTYLEDELAV